MTLSRKTPWIKKLTKWIKGSIERFAEKGFSDKPRKRSSKPPKKSIKKILKKKKVFLKKAKSKKKIVRLKVKAAVPKPFSPNAKKKVAKLSLVKAAASKVKAVPQPEGIFIGKIAHYFDKAKACAFKVEKAEFKEGATIRILGPKTDFKMKVKSIQINRIPVPSGRPGEDVGMGVTKPVAVGDSIYLIA